jgi:alpha-L-rhamnosidase
MERFLAMQEATEYRTRVHKGGAIDGQYADWLSFEDYERCNGRAHIGNSHKNPYKPEAVRYWNFLAGCYWRWDALMMAEMAGAIGCEKSVAKYSAMAEKALAYLRREYVDPSDGLLVKEFRHLQGAAVFALKLGVLESAEAVAATKDALRRNIAEHDGCNMTGFLGTSVIMDVLTENGMTDVAYSLFLNHKFPSWLYSVDQGATTIWERWNSYTKKDGFGPVGMNSFNHYAYGAVMGWVYKTVGGIAPDPKSPGFKNILMRPVPDRRLGFAEVEFRSPAGLVKSAWRYDGPKWTWTFTVPEGATADVTLPGETASKRHAAGTYTVVKTLD